MQGSHGLYKTLSEFGANKIVDYNAMGLTFGLVYINLAMVNDKYDVTQDQPHRLPVRVGGAGAGVRLLRHDRREHRAPGDLSLVASGALSPV